MVRKPTPARLLACRTHQLRGWYKAKSNFNGRAKQKLALSVTQIFLANSTLSQNSHNGQPIYLLYEQVPLEVKQFFLEKNIEIVHQNSHMGPQRQLKQIGLVKLHWLANKILATHSNGWANYLTFYLFASKSLMLTIGVALYSPELNAQHIIGMRFRILDNALKFGVILH